MQMKKLPYGISDYEKIIKDNYYYVDKTMNIEKLENLSELYIMFLRPLKFGKMLFTSTLEHYYDINQKDEAENILGNLFKAFYIQKASERLYVIIDEYDHFSNELLEFGTEKFKYLVSKNGKIRK